MRLAIVNEMTKTDYEVRELRWTMTNNNFSNATSKYLQYISTIETTKIVSTATNLRN